MMKLNRNYLLLLVAIAVVVLGVFFVVEQYGPSDSAAYQIAFGSEPPDYIQSLKTEYRTHLKGYRLYIGFVVPSDKVHEILDQNSLIPMHQDGYMEQWTGESIFRKMGFSDFPNPKDCLMATTEKPGELWEFVCCPESGHIFCEYISDSDIE